jgi:GntP family gluconate:H+ symporter
VNPALATAHDAYLLACVAGTVALLLLLVGRLRLHAALGLSVAALALGVAAGIPLEKVPLAFTAGAGEMMGHIAIILGMGAILGQLLTSSGAGAALGKAMVDGCGPKGMPWALLVLGILVGIPVFFEVGLVLLMPIVVDAARRSGRPPMLVGLPVLAGLSAMHCLLPPHPGALLAAAEYHAALAPVMLWGLVAGGFAAILAGPLLFAVLNRLWERPGSFLRSALPLDAAFGGAAAVKTEPATGTTATPAKEAEKESEALEGSAGTTPAKPEGLAAPAPAGALLALLAILLPVALILAGGWADAITARGTLPNRLLHLAGFPDVAMVVAALVALATLGRRVQEPAYRSSGGLRRLTIDAFAPIASPLVILAAAGGLSGVLRASGAAQAAVTFAMGAHMPPLLLAWALAATVRVSMGSATVAMALASGILAPMAGTMGVRPELLVLATGFGSILLSHVNDSGFWLIGSLFKIDVKSTLATWSVLETVLSLAGLAATLLLSVLLK